MGIGSGSGRTRWTPTGVCLVSRVAGRMQGDAGVQGRLRLASLICTVSAICGVAGPVRAGGGPENVAVIVNADSWASRAIANEYVALRGIPAANVIHLSGIRDIESIKVDAFRDTILTPVLQQLWDRKLLEQIDCLAYSADFPTAVDLRPDVGKIDLPKHLSATGSITGLTYLYQFVIAKRPEVIGLSNNFYMRRPQREVARIPTSEADRRAYQQAQQLVAAQQWEAAVAVIGPLAERLPQDEQLQYVLARCLGQLKRADQALAALGRAVDAGWSGRTQAQSDQELALIRSRPEFGALLARMDENAKQDVRVQPSLGFRSQFQWNDRGEVTADQGVRYMLSTMLAVTSGRGNSVTEAVDSLRRSAAADGSAPSGTVYFMSNQDVRSTTREPLFASAAQALNDLGVKSEIVVGTIPRNRPDVAGAMVGAASFQWGPSQSTILPGAICEHLTSFGGAMRETAGQTPFTEFVRYGAAGSSGTVVEPFSIQAKFPDPFLHVHYARGCSLAESFYQSVFGPYQLLIVGDPLCQPWARSLNIVLDRPVPQDRVSGQLVLEPRIDGTDDPGSVLDRWEVFINGRRMLAEPQTRPFGIDTTGLGDGWHELRIVAVAAGPIATQSRLILPLIVDNQGRSVTLERPAQASDPVAYGEPLVVRASAADAEKIEILHQQVVVGSLDDSTGTVSIDTRVLGSGPVTLQARTQYEGRSCLSLPLQVHVGPPAMIRPSRAVDRRKLVDGLQLTLGRASPVVLESTRDAKWLAEQEPQAGDPLALEGIVDIPADDVYQFQFRGNSITALSVSDQVVWRSPGKPGTNVAWQAVPVQLGRGTHRVRVEGTVAKTPTLQIRFGGPGCTSLDGKRFRHVPR